MSNAPPSVRSDDVDILIVDDSANDAELTTLAFRHLTPRPRILWLNDSQLAVDYLLCRGHYERSAPRLPLLVMTDIHMPHLSGLELLMRIRAEPRLRALPVIVLSGGADPEEVRECARLGSNGYVTKFVAYEAFTTQVMLAVRPWLEAAGPSDPAGQGTV